MFQSVRPNSQIYVFHSGAEPYLEIGSVINQPLPKPKYQIPVNFGQPQEMVVDLVVKINGQSVNYNGLPAQMDAADTFSNGESIVVADSRDAITSEIFSQKQKSLDIVNNFEPSKLRIAKLDKILNELHPEYAEKDAQMKEIQGMKDQINAMTQTIGELMATNRQLIEKLSSNNIK